MEFDAVFAEPGKDGIIDGVRADERGIYSGETLDEVRTRYPHAKRYTWDEWRAEVGARQDAPITWSVCDEAKFMEMLEVLPPMDWDGYGFLVSEACDHSVTTGRPRYSAFRQIGTRYESSDRPITRAEFRACKAERLARVPR